MSVVEEKYLEWWRGGFGEDGEAGPWVAGDVSVCGN